MLAVAAANGAGEALGEGAMSEILQDPVFPPKQPLDSELTDRLSEIARRRRRAQSVRLVLSDDEHLELPSEVVEVLKRVVGAMSKNQAVVVAPLDLSLTTQQAADFLGVQRTFLVGLLDTGEIPFQKPGRHRHVRLDDLLDYRKKRSAECRESLGRLVEIGEDAGMYEGTATPIPTR